MQYLPRFLSFYPLRTTFLFTCLHNFQELFACCLHNNPLLLTEFGQGDLSLDPPWECLIKHGSGLAGEYGWTFLLLLTESRLKNSSPRLKWECLINMILDPRENFWTFWNCSLLNQPKKEDLSLDPGHKSVSFSAPHRIRTRELESRPNVRVSWWTLYSSQNVEQRVHEP